MKNIRIFSYYSLFFIGLVLLVFFTVHNRLDPDFGWHLRTGQLILERGVPHQDWYTYTMPDFPWIDHEWLTDVLMYVAHTHLGMYALSFIFTLLYIASFFVIKKPGQNFWSFFIVVTLGSLATIDFLGLRPQLLSILFTAILLKIVNKFLYDSSKLIYCLPLLFILWTNMHAGFFAGLFILAILIALEICKRFNLQEIKNLRFLRVFQFKTQPSKKILILGIIFILSFLVTMINPYGIGIYEEIFRTVGDGFLKFHIAEWLPLPFSGFRPFIYLYIGFFIALLLRFYRQMEFNEVVLSCIFLLFSLSSIRYFLIFVMITAPILAQFAYQLKNQINIKQTYKTLTVVDKVSLILMFIVLMGLLSYYGFYQFSSAVLSKEFYPVKAISYMKTLPLSKNMFNDYGWGGYMIWKLPERKVFIDGRMPSWRQDGRFVFGDYFNIMQVQKGFEKILDTYDVQLVLIRKSIKDDAEAQDKLPKNTKFKQFFEQHRWLNVLSAALGIYKSNDNIYTELTKLGWKVIYQDDTALILEKSHND